MASRQERGAHDAAANGRSEQDRIEPRDLNPADRGAATRVESPRDTRTVDDRSTTDVVTAREGADPRSDTQARVEAQRARFGGFKPGAAFFGWLVAIGLGALLTAIASGAGAALALSQLGDVSQAAEANAETIGLAGGIALVAIVLVSYFAGGYVAGRLARFDGMRQGVGVWVIGILVTVAFALAGYLFGSEYNALNRLNLPNIPVDQGDLTSGGVVALAVAAIGSLVAAVLGGKAGEAYHRKIDRVGDRAVAGSGRSL
jgi:hypothetical protein